MTLDDLTRTALAPLLLSAAAVWLAAGDGAVEAHGGEACYVDEAPWQRDRLPRGARGEPVRGGRPRHRAGDGGEVSAADYSPSKANRTEARVRSQRRARVAPSAVTSRNCHESWSKEWSSASTVIGARTTSRSGVYS